MPIEQTRSKTQTNDGGAATVAVCPNCRAEMPSALRFCRACGFRLGEGVAEFTETVRFERAQTGEPLSQATSDTQASTKATPKWQTGASVNDWGALAKGMGHQAGRNAPQHAKEWQPGERSGRNRKWKGWLIAVVIISVLSGGGLTGGLGLRGLRDSMRGGSSASASRSWVGVDQFETTDKGVTFDEVKPPGSPADKAGLVGGDQITSFDGQPVKSADELRKLLAAMPIGKTVDVVYIRDGETKQTKLTTTSEEEIKRLEDAADERTQGFVGIGTSSEQVAIPGTNISGVQLNSVRRNNPAYIAGMRDGDIVIEFDRVPIRTYDELESRTRRAVPDSTVKVIVMRGAERIELLIKVGIDD